MTCLIGNQAMAQAKAKPRLIGFSGFGFGSRNSRPKAQQAKAKAGAFRPSRAKAITRCVNEWIGEARLTVDYCAFSLSAYSRSSNHQSIENCTQGEYPPSTR